MADTEFSFESALAELEGIVTALEAGKVGLDESLSLYERGVELVRLCNRRLDEAGQRVEAVRADAEGGLTVKPFTGDES